MFAKDWVRAHDRAVNAFGWAYAPVVSACYRHGCNQFKGKDDGMERLKAMLDAGDLRDRVTAMGIRYAESSREWD